MYEGFKFSSQSKHDVHKTLRQWHQPILHMLKKDTGFFNDIYLSMHVKHKKKYS